MKVAAVQFKARKGQFEQALDRLSALTEAGAQHADLVVLPEMAATGYLFDSPEAARAVAEPARGPTFARLSPIAAAHGAWIVCGFPERDKDALFNSALIINPAGELAFTYRKTLLYEADVPWACEGDSGYRAFDTELGRFAVGICMDLNDDAFIEWCAAAQLRAIAFPTNWLDEGTDIWPYWAWRAEPTHAALIAANTYGPEGEILFHGRSCVLDGRVIRAASESTGDDVIVATLP